MINDIKGIMKTFILDFETSGFNPYQDDIIEIGAIETESGETFSSLIRPKSEKEISQRITEVTGITNRLLRQVCREHGWTKGGWYDGFAEFYFWMIDQMRGDTECAIVSHNGTVFDFIYLKQYVKHLREGGGDTIDFDRLKIHYIDTLLLSKRLVVDRYSYKQGSLCKLFEIKVDVAHRALADVEALEKLYEKLRDQLRCRGYETTSQEVIDYIELRV